MNPESERDQDVALVEKAVSALIEHFDCVQIFVSRSVGAEGTVFVNKGRGNWFARYGQAKDWITKEEQVSRNGLDNE